MANFNINGQSINTQGLALGDCDPVILFPSGLIPEGEPGRDLDAGLIQINSTFGFNTTASTFNTQWVPRRGKDPKSFHGASGQIPNVGKIIGFTVGQFLVSGEITHSDYNIDSGGTIVTINIRDNRRCLDKVRILTEDLVENPGSGTISVARAVRLTTGFTDLEGSISERRFIEYRKVLEQGATYEQILTAIQLAIDDGEIDFNINSLPSVDDLVANIGGDAQAIRFRFDAAPLTEVITRVLESAAYDWYWSMSEQRVRLVNRKIPFRLEESDLLDTVASLGSASGLDQTIRISYGDDLVDQPRRVQLLGARQEGFINSPLLSPLDGIDTAASGVVFYPAWPNFTVQFTDGFGILRSYKPTDLELQAALKGIEHWTYFKKYQTAPPNLGLQSPGFGLPPDAGSIAAQSPDFQSRVDPAQPLSSLGGNESGQLRVINNRRDASQNWVINFFNRVRDHAARFYGRAYIASGLLANEASGAFQIAQGAWANVENQVEGQPISVNGSSGLFVDNYEINRDLSPLAPFLGTDERVDAHCILPSGTVYGVEGDEAPASFGQWTEDYNVGNTPAASGRRTRTGEHYIPVTLTEVGELTQDPRDPLRAFEEYPEGTVLCELPNIASSGLADNFIFRNLVTLVEDALESTSSGLVDIVDPGILVQPYDSITGVAIPIVATQRYGTTFPGNWTSGNLAVDCDSVEVVIDDQFGPWNFPPQGTVNSLQLLQDRAIRRLDGLISPAATSTYSEIELVDFPRISYDSFSNDEPNESGLIGVRNHGVTNINFSLGSNGIRTNYRIASFFGRLGEPAPLEFRSARAILNGIITPIDSSQISAASPGAPTPRFPGPPTPPPTISTTNPLRGETVRRVTITEVNNALTFFSVPNLGTQERYRGQTEQLYDAPPSLNATLDPDLRFDGGAVCIDGFLNIGDEALYHVNEFRLSGGRRTTQRYFSGGRSFSNGTIVEVVSAGSNPNTFDVAIVDTNPERRLANVPLLNGAISIGDRTTLASQANQGTPRVLQRTEADLSTPGIFLNPGGNSSTPVEVIAVTNVGTSGALVSVRPLVDRGDVDNNGTVTSNVVPIPNPEFVIVGDKGTLITSTVLDTTPVVPGAGEQTVGNFFVSNRQNFLRFN